MLVHSLQYIYIHIKMKINVCASISWQKTAAYSFPFCHLPIHPYSYIDNANNRMRCMPISKCRKKRERKILFFCISYCSLVLKVNVRTYTQWTWSYIQRTLPWIDFFFPIHNDHSLAFYVSLMKSWSNKYMQNLGYISNKTSLWSDQ
jgi:hypothetical protein